MEPNDSLNEGEEHVLTDTEESDSSSSEENEDEKTKLAKSDEALLVKEPKIEVTEEELNDLVHKLLSFLTISHPAEAEATTVEPRVKGFLSDGAVRALFLYNENDSLRADELVNLKERTAAMYYVKRNSYDEITPTNFRSAFIFGNVDENFEEALIFVLKYVYAPLLYSMTDLPYTLRIRVTRSLEEFLCSITEKYNRQSGRTMLYTPAIVMVNNEHVISHVRQDDLLCLFESIVVRWCAQLSELISDEHLDYRSIPDFGPAIVIEFWEYRLENLLFVRKSLRDEKNLSLCKVLEDHYSVHVRLLNDLTKRLEDKIEETRSNVTFLETLKPICEKFCHVTLDSVTDEIPALISNINEIIANSPYLKSERNSLTLIESMNQLIVNICKRYVKVEDILRGQTEDSVKAVNQSMMVCTTYAKTLQEFQENRSFTDKHVENICGHVNMFNQRCADLLELCSMVNIFHEAKNFQNRRIILNYFLKTEDKLSLISEEFFSSLNEMQLTQENIFNFQNETWYTNNYRFQDKMEQIKGNIVELIEEGFTYVKTIADGIDMLRLMYPYSKWLPIRNIFEQKYVQIVEKFLHEIRDVKNYLLIEIVKLQSRNVHRMTEITSISTKKRWIQCLFELLDSCDWLKPFSASKSNEYRDKYQEVKHEINQIIIDEYKKWNGKLPPSILKRLKRPLIAKCFHEADLLETNIDRKILKVIEEGNAWTQIGFIPTSTVENLMKSSRPILSLFGNVEELVLTYNRIVTMLSSDERSLFSPFMKKCDETVTPALHTLWWDSETSNKTVLDYLKQIKYVENLVQNYKAHNKRFIDTCKEICRLNLVHITKVDLSEIIEEFQGFRLLCFKKLVTYYNQLLSCIQSVFDSFGYRISKTKKIWNAYIRKMDHFLLQALRCCLKNTLRNALYSISTNPHTELIPMSIKLAAGIKDKEIIFQPELLHIKTFFYTLKINLFEIIKLVPRLFNEFRMSTRNKEPSYSQQLFADDDISEIQRQINAEMENNLQKVRTRMSEWNKYESLWKTDVDDHVDQHIVEFSDIDPYHISFSAYSAIVNDMNFEVSTEETVSMFQINMDALIAEIVLQCERRLLRLSVVLKQMLYDRLLNISTHIDKEYTTLHNFQYKTKSDLIILKNILNESTAIEREVIRIGDYKHLLRKFNFTVEPQLIKMETNLHEKCAKYANIVQRCRLRMEKVHGIHL